MNFWSFIPDKKLMRMLMKLKYKYLVHIFSFRESDKQVWISVRRKIPVKTGEIKIREFFEYHK